MAHPRVRRVAQHFVCPQLCTAEEYVDFKIMSDLAQPCQSQITYLMLLSKSVSVADRVGP